MKKKYLFKCLMTFGLLLFFTLLIPFTSYNVKTALAGSIDKEKNVDYRLNLKSITLVKGKAFQLKAYNLSENAKVSFKSDDTEIASVNDDGVIYAKQVGTTIVTAFIKDNAGTNSLTCEVTVGPPAFSVKITRSRIVLGLDKSDQLRVILKPSNTAEAARFSSYDPSIASVSVGGRVTAKNLGLTYLFAEIDATNNDGNRKFAVSTVIVTNSDDAPLVDDYFNKHPELDMISEADLSGALEVFFNGKSDNTPYAQKYSGSSLVDALDKYLNNKFDLAALRSTRD